MTYHAKRGLKLAIVVELAKFYLYHSTKFANDAPGFDSLKIVIILKPEIF